MLAGVAVEKMNGRTNVLNRSQVLAVCYSS
jgi:hypothetical protein